MEGSSTDPRRRGRVTVGFVAVAAVVLVGVVWPGVANAAAPTPEFNHTYDATNGTVTVQLAYGAVVDADRTHICGDGVVNPGGGWHEYDPDTGPDDEVVPGDTATVEVTDGSYHLVIRWSEDRQTAPIVWRGPGPASGDGPGNDEPDGHGCFEYTNPSHSGSTAVVTLGYVGALALVFVGTGHLLAVVASKLRPADEES
jgi:hypothetical protein